MDTVFSQDDIVYAYTRKQALEDGFQVDANAGVFGEVSKNYIKYPMYMTRGVFDLIEKKVTRPGSHYDRKGIWADICWMLKLAIVRSGRNTDTVEFKVKVGRNIETFVAKVGTLDIDDPQPAITIMFPGED